jgi:hypothetical protein
MSSIEKRSNYLMVERQPNLTFLPVPVHDTVHGTYSRICTTDLWICILLQIMLYLSVDDKMPTKDNFFLHCSAYYYLKVNLL